MPELLDQLDADIAYIQIRPDDHVGSAGDLALPFDLLGSYSG